MSTSLGQLQKVYQHIREHGTIRVADHRFGGIWSSDIWDLNGFMAQQADDGVSQGIGDARGIIGWSTYGRPVDYWQGRTEADIAAVYQTFFPDNA
jgi:hypothetical protein